MKQTDLAVDFIRYKADKDYFYGAFLFDKEGFVKFASLGKENEVNANHNLIWSFLDDNTHRYSDIYFSTDGFLSGEGIEYLCFPDGTPIDEIYNLHRVFHLSEINRDAHIGSNIVAVGISDHNSPIGESDMAYRGNWTDLENVRTEMALISTRLEKLKPRILFNDAATEPVFKSLSGSDVTTLHISTHGFFRSADMLRKAAANPADYDHHIARRFLVVGDEAISGLVMRQGNISWQVKEILEDYDDLLTAEEIENMRFPNLQLTVLSACDTGLGDTDSEGVWGLQRAFRIAGTKSLICTLSKVDDYWAAQFMDIFYEQAALGKSIYDSFQTAQRWLRNEQPERPEVWSSFILIE